MAQRPELTALDGERNAFDPELVPAYPLVRAEIRQTDAGDLQGVADDVVVATDVELEPVRRAVIAAAAKVAAKRVGPVRAVRVRGIAPDESVFHLVVTAAGEVYETSEPGRSTTQNGRRASAGKAAKNGQAAGDAEREGFSPLFIGVVLVMVVVLVLLCVPFGLLIAKHLSAGDHKGPAPAPKPVQLPVVAPAPYGDVARWSVKLGTSTFSSDGVQVAADADRVYVARDGGNNIAAYSAKTGRRKWQYTDLHGAASAGPALATVDGHQVVTVASASGVVLLNPATGHRAGEWRLANDGGSVRMTATGPMVTSDAGHAQVVTGGRLATRVVPATGTPVAPTADGGLIVVGPSGQVWTVRDDRVAAAPQTLPAPAGMSYAGIGGWSGRQLVLVYHASTDTGSNQVSLAAYHFAPATPGATTGWVRDWVSGPVPTAYSSTQDLPLRAAPSGAWGIYGSAALNLATGAAVTLPDDWATTAIGDERAFGTGSGRPLVVTGSGALTASISAPQPPTTTNLVGPQATYGTAAYIVTSPEGTTAILYALRLPKGADTATTTGTSVAPAPTSTPAPAPKKPARPAKTASAKPHNHVSPSKKRSSSGGGR